MVQMNTKAFETYESEVRSYCRNFPAVFTTAKGPFLYDEDGGNISISSAARGGLTTGTTTTTSSQGCSLIWRATVLCMRWICIQCPSVSSLIFYEEKILKPRGLNYKIQFAGPTGTNAVEAALKLARKVKKRTNIFAMMGAFHGMTLGSIAMTTDASSRAGAGVPLTNVDPYSCSLYVSGTGHPELY